MLIRMSCLFLGVSRVAAAISVLHARPRLTVLTVRTRLSRPEALHYAACNSAHTDPLFIAELLRCIGDVGDNDDSADKDGSADMPLSVALTSKALRKFCCATVLSLRCAVLVPEMEPGIFSLLVAAVPGIPGGSDLGDLDPAGIHRQKVRSSSTSWVRAFRGAEKYLFQVLL